MAACQHAVMNVAHRSALRVCSSHSQMLEDKTQSITLATDTGRRQHTKTRGDKDPERPAGTQTETENNPKQERIPSELLSSFSAIFQIRGTPFALLALCFACPNDSSSHLYNPRTYPPTFSYSSTTNTRKNAYQKTKEKLNKE